MRLFGAIYRAVTGRSPKWPAARRQWLRAHPECEACGGRGQLDVHHVTPFHKDPSRELDPANFMTLCRPHHLFVGHLMAWASWNPDARTDAAAWRAKVKNRPA